MLSGCARSSGHGQAHCGRHCCSWVGLKRATKGRSRSWAWAVFGQNKLRIAAITLATPPVWQSSARPVHCVACRPLHRRFGNGERELERDRSVITVGSDIGVRTYLLFGLGGVQRRVGEREEKGEGGVGYPQLSRAATVAARPLSISLYLSALLSPMCVCWCAESPPNKL